MAVTQVAQGGQVSKLRRAWNWGLAQWDTLIALAAAAVFAVVGVTGDASEKTVRAATLAVLGLVAIMIIRLRSDRANVQREVSLLRTDATTVAGTLQATSPRWRAAVPGVCSTQP